MRVKRREKAGELGELAEVDLQLFKKRVLLIGGHPEHWCQHVVRQVLEGQQGRGDIVNQGNTAYILTAPHRTYLEHIPRHHVDGGQVGFLHPVPYVLGEKEVNDDGKRDETLLLSQRDVLSHLGHPKLEEITNHLELGTQDGKAIMLLLYRDVLFQRIDVR